MHYDLSIKDALMYVAMGMKMDSSDPDSPVTEWVKENGIDMKTVESIPAKVFADYIQWNAKQIAKWVKKNGKYAQESMRVE